MPRPRRLSAVAAGAALVVAPLAVAATPATAATTSVALVGSLQDELGCPGDWQPACADTELARVGRLVAVPGHVRPAGRHATSSRSPSTTPGTSTTGPGEP